MTGAGNIKLQPPQYRCRINIRPADAADLPTLVSFGRQFYEHTQFAKTIAYSPDGAEMFFNSMASNDLLFVADDAGKVAGVIGVIIGPCLINPSYGMASELFWWVDPAYRRTGVGDQLMDAAEQAAKDQGATFFTMVALEGGTVEAAARIYERRGYIAAERTFTKVL